MIFPPALSSKETFPSRRSDEALFLEHVALIKLGSFLSLDINECSSSPCLNEGVCLDAVNGFTCQCRDGLTGLRCETGKSFQSAIHGLDLVSHLTDLAKLLLQTVFCLLCWVLPIRVQIISCNSWLSFCQCFSNMYNLLAFHILFSCQSSDINECSSTPCLNKGVCQDQLNGFECRCQSGFTGNRCETGKGTLWLGALSFSHRNEKTLGSSTVICRMSSKAGAKERSKRAQLR